MAQNEFLYTNENGIEFWTRESDGESAVSIRGLARMCGVTLKEIQRYLGLDDKTGGKILKPLTGLTFYLTTNLKKNGKEIKPIRCEVAALIIEHVAFERGKPEARASIKAFLHIGIAHYIQSKTGWTDKPAAPEAQAQLDRILDEPIEWEGIYPKEVLEKISKWYPLYQRKDFFWTYFYRFLNVDEQKKLDKLNPINPETHQRSRRIHQYLDIKTRNRLKDKIKEVIILVKLADTLTDFHHLYQRIHGDNVHKNRVDNLGS